MIFNARRDITICTLALFVATIYLVITGRIRIFQQYVNPSDNLNTALYLLSTLAQSISAMLGITIAVLFISAQINSKTEYSRTLIAIYRSKSTIMAIFFMCVSVISSLVSLAMLGTISYRNSWYVLDINLSISIASICLLVPLVLEQLENINPYALAKKFVRGISANSIKNYGLVIVNADSRREEVFQYELRQFGYGHGLEDPLGPIHELIMGAVSNKDRTQLTALLRTLIGKIASVCATSYKIEPSQLRRHLSQANILLQRTFKTPETVESRLRVAIHIFHYVVRRSFYLKKEWDSKDYVRQSFIIAVRDLIDSLIIEISNAKVIDVSLYAIMHICLGYNDVKRHGRYEPNISMFSVANDLYKAGFVQQANLAIDVLACLSVRTRQFEDVVSANDELGLDADLQARFEKEKKRATEDPSWFPGEEDGDPWRYRLLEEYEFPSLHPSTGKV